MRHKFKAISLFLKQVSIQRANSSYNEGEPGLSPSYNLRNFTMYRKFHPLPVKHGYVVSILGTFVAAQRWTRVVMKLSDLEQLVLPISCNIHRQLMCISYHLKSKLFSTWALIDCVRIFYKTQDPFARALQLSITACNRLQRRLPCPSAVIDVVGDLNSNELTSTCASIWWYLPEIPKTCPAN